MSTKTVNVLLVHTDNHGRDKLVQAFQQHWPACPLVLAKNGAEALGILRGTAETLYTRPPHLILLCLTPQDQADCFAFLQELRGDAVLRRQPVYVLSHSKEEEDIVRAYDFLIAGYLLTTHLHEQYLPVIELLRTYIEVVEFPDYLANVAPTRPASSAQWRDDKMTG